MYKELHDKAISYFNNNEPEKFYDLMHDDLQVFRLMTGEVIIDGLEALKENNRQYMEEGKVKFKNINSIEFDNILITFQEIVGHDAERISIIEFEDGKMKRSWVSQFNKDHNS